MVVDLYLILISDEINVSMIQEVSEAYNNLRMTQDNTTQSILPYMDNYVLLVTLSLPILAFDQVCSHFRSWHCYSYVLRLRRKVRSGLPQLP